MSLRQLPAVVALSLTAAAIVVSCGGDKNESIADINDTRNFPTMTTTDVSSFVSDSGYTRYHITAPVWYMYEEADTPHWTFPEGLYMEKYDDDMNVNATFTADSATYFSALKRWRFDGRVNMRNTDGDRFATPQLFWDQNQRRVYSDSFMHIVRQERIIEGYGFESNEAMTEYTILHPQMILPVDRMRAQRDERRQQDSIAAVTDSAAASPATAPEDAPPVDDRHEATPPPPAPANNAGLRDRERPQHNKPSMRRNLKIKADTAIKAIPKAKLAE
ncbi:MAG: LPS export ABC transporter periplasmic protein LptC [Clostridiales bacterium]|nr:LPS export ABC transporter periplasmic protein LptC [Clostridiales bacterium]